jgi:salicylate hydroxylase
MATILIIGAGIGGLTAALALQRQGDTVRVFERAPVLGEVGAGLTVGPNMMHGLDWLGVAPAVLETACIPAHGGVLDLATGELLVANARGPTPALRYGQPYLQIHRADLHSVLADAVHRRDPSALVLDHTLSGLEQDEQGVRAHFSNGNTATGDFLVGADGSRSAVREILFPGHAPRFTGYVAWRGLVPMERLPALKLTPDSAILVAPGRSFARYRVRRGELLNYAAFVDQGDWTEESWSLPANPGELLARLHGSHPDVAAIVNQTPAGQCYRWGLFDRDPLPRWSEGRVTLLGDAAHPMLPFLGQGAAMAVEDAIVLARCLDARPGTPAALALYEETRRARTALVQEASRGAVRRFHQSDGGGYSRARHRDAEALGLFKYHPGTAPLGNPGLPSAAAAD